MNKIIKVIFERKFLRIWLMVIGILFSLLAFEEIVDDVFYDPKEGDLDSKHFDKSIMNFVASLRSPLVNQMMTDLTALGSVSVVLMLFLVLASVLYSYRDFKGIIYLTSVLTGAALWPFVLKPYFARVRPEEIERLVNVTDMSFPSGHSFGAAAVYIGLAFYSAQYARTWAQEVFFYILGTLLIVVVGVSRIFLGVHYPTDVLAGISGGVAWGLIVSVVYETLRVRMLRSESL